MLLPEFKELFWQSRQRLFPAFLLLIDGAAVIGEKRILETTNFYFCQTIINRSIDDRGRAL